MSPGEKRRLWIPAKLAFASHVAHHGVKKMVMEEPPPMIDLTFDLELVRILKAPERPLNLKSPPSTALDPVGARD